MGKSGKQIRRLEYSALLLRQLFELGLDAVDDLPRLQLRDRLGFFDAHGLAGLHGRDAFLAGSLVERQHQRGDAGDVLPLGQGEAALAAVEALILSDDEVSDEEAELTEHVRTLLGWDLYDGVSWLENTPWFFLYSTLPSRAVMVKPRGEGS